jgi:acetoin utilization protein AcuB
MTTVAEPRPPAPSPTGSTRAALTAADVMSAPVITVSASDTLWTAWGLIYRAGFRHLVVVDGTRCVGVLDDRHIVLAWPFGPLGKHQTGVGDVIARGVHCVLPDTPVPTVAEIMLTERTDAVPVVNGRGEILGLITVGDMLTVLAGRHGWTP